MVKGMVTRISDVKPQVSVVTYTCDSCGSEIYQEISGTQFRPLDKCPSTRCTDNDTVGKLQMQTRGSRFVKYQVGGEAMHYDRILFFDQSSAFCCLPPAIRHTSHSQLSLIPLAHHTHTHPSHALTNNSIYSSTQEMRLQELPDQVPVGHIPRSVTVHCRGGRTRLCGPGDIVTVSGIFLAVRPDCDVDKDVVLLCLCVNGEILLE